MENLEDVLYDDVEAKYLTLQKKKKNRKKRRRRKRLLIFLVLLCVGALYFFSDFSKVKSLDVSGNHFYSKATVLKEANLSYQTRYIIVPKFYIEWKLKKDKFIQDVAISKSLDGAIKITIREKPIIGYFIEGGKNYVLVSDGSRKELNSQDVDKIADYPLIDGFTVTEMDNLAASFNDSKNPVKPEIIAMISEMQPYETSYDKHMVKITMQDGNTIFTSYDSMPLLNDYLGTLKKLNKTNVCLWPDASTHAMHNESCSKKE